MGKLLLILVSKSMMKVLKISKTEKHVKEYTVKIDI